MYKCDVGRLVKIGIVIQSFFSNIIDAMPGAPMNPAQTEHFVNEMEVIAQQCSGIGLPKTRALLDAVVCDYRTVGHTQQQLKSIIACMKNQFLQELSERTFTQIEVDRESYLMTEEEFSVQPLFGSDVASAFSSTNRDAREAGNCFATFRHTACVFHSMRVLEKGLIALAHELKVPSRIPFEYENWQNIIEPIETAIRDFEKQQSKSPYKIETLKRYSEACQPVFLCQGRVEEPRHPFQGHVRCTASEIHSRSHWGIDALLGKGRTARVRS
jgi:hypothetical protein